MARRVTQRSARTAFGRWAKAQKHGALSAVQRDTGLAYSTVHEAQWRLTTPDVAALLAEISRKRKSRDGRFEYVLGHAFDADEMKVPAPASRVRHVARRAGRAA